jgi:predicted nucleic acid-binding protein
VLETEAGELVVPAPVTAEADYLLHRRLGEPSARAFMRDIAEGRFRVECLTQEEHGMALTLHDRYRDLALGLADLSVIILAGRFGARRILTFDERHFRLVTPLQGGSFVLLPADDLNDLFQGVGDQVSTEESN